MGKHTEKLELIDVDQLIPYANNARTHSDEQIKKIQASLREFGFINPVLIDKDCGIIAGHGRVEAAKREGLAQVPCVWVEHLTEAQKRAYILADNRLAMDAGWDMEMLSVELECLNEIDFDIDLTGFTDIEIDGLLGADAEPIDDSGNGGITPTDHVLSIDRTKVILTDDEYEQITRRLNSYIEDNGVSFGFVGWLLDG